MTHHSVEIVDVSARDGLQNESRIFSLDEKIVLIEKSIQSGFKRLEVASFVHPKRVPQMAGAEELIAALPDSLGVTFIGLVMNMRGVERALSTKIDEIGCVCVATDTFADKNQGVKAWESVEIAKQMIGRALSDGRSANVAIGAAFGCPFEGEVTHSDVVDMAKALAEAGPHEIALADTIGCGDPWAVEALFGKVKAALPNISLRGHFHNTRNTGFANAYAAYKVGVKTLDVSIGGIGGCPFAPNATGNIAAEDLIYMFSRQGIETGINLSKVISASNWLSDVMEQELPALVSRAGVFPKSLSYCTN